MTDQFSLCLITAMDHLWYHHIILFPEPTSLLVSKTLIKPTSPRLSLYSPLDESFEELPSPLKDIEKSTDSSPVTIPLKDDSCNKEEEGKEMKMKERPRRLNLIRGSSNRSQSSSPSKSKLKKSMSCTRLMELELEEVNRVYGSCIQIQEITFKPENDECTPWIAKSKVASSG